MPSPRLHLLPWTQSLLSRAVAQLAGAWVDDGPLDLSTTLVVVPTRQSGRRLREALAAHAATRGQAVFPPRVLLPEELVALGLKSRGIASRDESLLAWIDVLRGITLDEFREVFPIDPPDRTFAWAARLAREFLRLQSTLAENGLRMADVRLQATGPFPESGRWHQLGELERRLDAALARRSLLDAQAARITAAKSPAPLPAIDHIVVLATPDPHGLALLALEQLATGIAVDVFILGPDDAAWSTLFDRWGRPSIAAWQQRPLDLPEFESCVHLCANPADQAERIVDCARACESGLSALALGIADPEVIAPLRNGLRRASLESYEPDGRTRRADPLHRVLELLAALMRESSFETAAALVRCPDVQAWLAAGGDTPFSAANLLAGFDTVHADHLPPTIAAARDHADRLAGKFPGLPRALDALTALHDTLRRERFPSNARNALTTLFANREFSLENPHDAAVVASAAAWNDVLADVAAALEKFSGVATPDAWDLALQAFGEARRYDEKPNGALEIQGWLELLWEDAPHLVVAGLNDGLVPGAIAGDPFLPDQLRERLGLKTNAARLARDAYLLQALAASRKTAGRIDLLLGKTSAAGDPLRPSRLLLQCDNAALPRRVGFLFGPAPANRASAPWRRAWPLHPGPAKAVTRVSVTAFRSYLECPFRFYLRHGLDMQAVDPHKAELDARDFGTLCHAALQDMGNDSSARSCTDPVRLREFLLAKLDHHARGRFGDALSLPLLIQLESARQRLAQVAGVQAAQAAEGWTILKVEHPIALTLGSVSVVGRIDRIDRHEATGRVRVLDYKTSDKPVNPRFAHTARSGSAKDSGTSPEFVRFTSPDGEQLVWIDLQLPLYRRALAAEFGAGITCGYFNMPRATGETSIALWENFDEAWQSSADHCCDGILAAIAARRFWPPAAIPGRNDDFASLFHHGAAASVAWQQ